ncbi:MAG: AAA family ATPase [Anaerolineaceae bacterium]|nr:AAA family ATPase [Anaerolineaceae bacterium]
MAKFKKAFDYMQAFENRGLRWTIPQWIPEGSVVLLAGAAGCGKSFLGLQAAIGLAGGGNAWGEEIKEWRKVLYLGADTNAHLFGQRLALLTKGLSKKQKQAVGENFYVKMEPVVLAENKALWDDVIALEAGFIVVDCLVRYLEGNTDTVIARTSPLFSILRTFAGIGSAVLVLHHFNKDKTLGTDRKSLARQIRGSSDLMASVDVAYGLESDGQNGLMKTVKNRVEQERRVGLGFKFGEDGLGAFEEVILSERERVPYGEMVISLKRVMASCQGEWMSRTALCEILEDEECLAGSRTMDKVFVSLGKDEGVETMRGRRGEMLYRAGSA